MQQTREGTLVLADISGYTAFVAATELEHSREILTELLETITDSLVRNLSVVKLQGDALLCTGERTGWELLDWLDATFTAFHRRVRDMTLVSACPCAACTNVGSLTLKFVAHHGTYSRIRVREAEDLVGNDVNIACRLLKNNVPSREYILATRPVLERIPRELRDRYVPIVEEYDVGRIEAGYVDLAQLREQARRPERLRVAADEAKLHSSRRYPVPPERIWRAYADPEQLRRVLGARRIGYRRGARGAVIGTEYHCYHGKEGHPPSILRLVSAAEPYELTLALNSDFGFGYATYRIERLPDGESQVDVYWLWDEPRSLPMRLALPVAMRYAVGRELRDLARVVAEPRASAAAS